MPIIFNGITRQIEVTDSSIFELEAGKELYSEWKRWQQLDTANAGFAPAFRAFGGDPTAQGQTAPKYYFLTNYWRVLINNGNVVSVALNLYSDNYPNPYVVVAGSGVSDRNSDAVNVNEEDIKNQSFLGGRVYIDDELGSPGIVYPLGTPSEPVDNYPDAILIALERNFRRYDLFGSITLGAEDISSTHWFGNGIINSSFTLGGGNSLGALFEMMLLNGVCNGRIAAINCVIPGLTDFSGALREAGIGGDIIVDSSNVAPLILRNCMSTVAGTSRPSLDINNANCDINIRGYRGGLIVKNITQNLNMSADFDSGTLELDTSCTNGTIVVSGVVQLIDNSGPGCTVVTDGTVTELTTGDVSADLNIINEGVQKASILIPHTTDL